MADNDGDDPSPSSSHPFFVRGGCELISSSLFIILRFYCFINLVPFVFLPSTLSTGFNFMNNHTHVSTTDDQSTNESKKEQENNEEGEVEEEEEEEKEGMYIYRWKKNLF